jgi:hypothetical protein
VEMLYLLEDVSVWCFCHPASEWDKRKSLAIPFIRPARESVRLAFRLAPAPSTLVLLIIIYSFTSYEIVLIDMPLSSPRILLIDSYDSFTHK